MKIYRGWGLGHELYEKIFRSDRKFLTKNISITQKMVNFVRFFHIFTSRISNFLNFCLILLQVEIFTPQHSRHFEKYCLGMNPPLAFL